MLQTPFTIPTRAIRPTVRWEMPRRNRSNLMNGVSEGHGKTSRSCWRRGQSFCSVFGSALGAGLQAESTFRSPWSSIRGVPLAFAVPASASQAARRDAQQTGRPSPRELAGPALADVTPNGQAFRLTSPFRQQYGGPEAAVKIKTDSLTMLETPPHWPGPSTSRHPDRNAAGSGYHQRAGLALAPARSGRPRPHRTSDSFNPKNALTGC